MSAADYEVIGLVILMGGLGSLVSLFIGDNGWHLPMIDQGVFRPGYLGNMLVGGLAALASWGMLQAAVLIGAKHDALVFKTSDMSNAIIVGFGRASWFKSQIEKVILQKTAAVAAGKPSDPGAAGQIASATPMEALRVANNMKS